jgi:hypothetical protein
MDQVRLVRGDHQLGPVSCLQFRGTTIFIVAIVNLR